MFIEKSDLTTVATDETVALLTAENDAIINQIIVENVALAKSYLDAFFDTETIFNATGEDRSQLLIKVIKDLVIYHIYIRHTRHHENEVALKRYEEAMNWLEMVAKGKINPNLPAKIDEETGEETHIAVFTTEPEGRINSDF